MAAMSDFMQKMSKQYVDHSRYLAVTPEMERWGLFVTATGRTHVPPGVRYPVGSHPADHELDWERGRVLDALQVVLISEGGGWLETKLGGLRRVEPGMLFLLLPNTWHRYRPDPALGWHEQWVEFGGDQVDALLNRGMFDEKNILLAGAIAAGVEEQLTQLQTSVLGGQSADPGELAADALRLLAACARLRSEHTPHHRVSDAIRTATRMLSEHHAEPLAMEEIARRVGMTYPHFRRCFKQLTGFAPWQYVLQVRMARARRLLSSSDATLDEVAWRVGFHSAYHFSHAFKRSHNIAPGEWRKRLLGRQSH